MKAIVRTMPWPTGFDKGLVEVQVGKTRGGQRSFRTMDQARRVAQDIQDILKGRDAAQTRLLVRAWMDVRNPNTRIQTLAQRLDAGRWYEHLDAIRTY
jgi:hypothetical protein